MKENFLDCLIKKLATLRIGIEIVEQHLLKAGKTQEEHEIIWLEEGVTFDILEWERKHHPERFISTAQWNQICKIERERIG